MTPQEEQLINSLVERVNQTQLHEKDPDAEALLNKELGSNPDALYILTQTVLVQNIALDQAKAQLAQLQQARQQPAHTTSFLGSLLGHHDPQSPPLPEYIPPPPPPVYVQPQYQQPQYVPVQPSFMRGAMQTAAGVAAGALAFEGVEAMLHGIGGFGYSGMGWGGGGFGMGPGFGGMGMMGGGFQRPIEETVINNNYYQEPGGGHGEMERGGFAPGGEEHPFHESAAQFDQGSAHLSDTSYDSGANQEGFDHSGSGDAGQPDNGGGFDDGGSGFDSGSFGGDSGGGDLL